MDEQKTLVEFREALLGLTAMQDKASALYERMESHASLQTLAEAQYIAGHIMGRMVCVSTKDSKECV